MSTQCRRAPRRTRRFQDDQLPSQNNPQDLYILHGLRKGELRRRADSVDAQPLELVPKLGRILTGNYPV